MLSPRNFVKHLAFKQAGSTVLLQDCIFGADIGFSQAGSSLKLVFFEGEGRDEEGSRRAKRGEEVREREENGESHVKCRRENSSLRRIVWRWQWR